MPFVFGVERSDESRKEEKKKKWKWGLKAAAFNYFESYQVSQDANSDKSRCYFQQDFETYCFNSPAVQIRLTSPLPVALCFLKGWEV